MIQTRNSLYHFVHGRCLTAMQQKSDWFLNQHTSFKYFSIKNCYTTYLLKCRTNNNTRLYPIVQFLAKQQYLSTPFIRKRVGDIYSNQYELAVF